jgi:hypothetical protein
MLDAGCSMLDAGSMPSKAGRSVQNGEPARSVGTAACTVSGPAGRAADIEKPGKGQPLGSPASRRHPGARASRPHLAGRAPVSSELRLAAESCILHFSSFILHFHRGCHRGWTDTSPHPQPFPRSPSQARGRKGREDGLPVRRRARGCGASRPRQLVRAIPPDCAEHWRRLSSRSWLRHAAPLLLTADRSLLTPNAGAPVAGRKKVSCGSRHSRRGTTVLAKSAL